MLGCKKGRYGDLFNVQNTMEPFDNGDPKASRGSRLVWTYHEKRLKDETRSDEVAKPLQ